jgi:hypothetical protein
MKEILWNRKGETKKGINIVACSRHYITEHFQGPVHLTNRYNRYYVLSVYCPHRLTPGNTPIGVDRSFR